MKVPPSFYVFVLYSRRVLLHVNFLAPLFLVLLWVTPIVQGPLMAGSWNDESDDKQTEPV